MQIPMMQAFLMQMWRILGGLFLALAVGATLPGQGEAYAFNERAPRSALEQVVQAQLPRLVKIHGASGLRTIQPYGTGVIVSKQGHILALDQVMMQEGQTSVVLHDGSVHSAELLPADNALGVRMIKIDAKRPLDFVEPAVDATLEPGMFVLSIGNCFRLAEYSEKLSATSGVLVAWARTGLRYRLADVDYQGDLLITDAANNPGHGGGGLFTIDGRWVGLNAKLAQSRETNTDISAAIPVAALVPYIERWTRGKIAPVVAAAAVIPVRHGIKLFDHGGGQTSPPAYIEKVEPGSPAARVGLRADDLVVRVDEVTVRTCRQFDEAMRGRRPGDRVAITYKRGNKVVKVELELEEQKS